MFKHLLTLAAAACITMGASAAVLWQSDDENGFLVDWGKPCVAITAEEVAEAIAPGDYIQVTTVGVDPENGWPQVALFGQFGGWPPLTNDGVGGKTYPYVSSFPVTNELYASISADGLSVSGNGAYVGKVEVVPSGVEVGPNTLWFGNKQCGWGNGVSLAASYFQDIRPYDKLVFYTDGVGFQVLFGSWGGLNVPCYEFPENVTYQDGKATYTITKQYAEDGVLDQVKANGIVMHGTVTITRIDYIPTDILSEAVGHATTIPGWEDETNIAPDPDLTVYELMGNKLRINAWAGYEGYDIIAEFDENWDIIGLTNVVNGVEGQTYDSGWSYMYTGNGDEYLAAYISTNYDLAGSVDGEGCLWLQGYLNGNDFVYYYAEWPLTAEELSEAILAAYEEDIDQIQEWNEALAELQNTYAGFAATETGAADLSAIAQAIQEYNQEVADALEAAAESWGYTSPLSGSIITEVNEMIIGAVADCTEFAMAIDAAAQADNQTLAGYADELEEFLMNNEPTETTIEVATQIAEKLLELQAAVEAAGNEALTETGVYVSPLTEEALAELDTLMILLQTTGIEGIEADAEGAIYFDVNGLNIVNPVAGQMVIKVKNGTITKVIVK